MYKRRVADAGLAAHFANRRAILRLLRYEGDLRLWKLRLLYPELNGGRSQIRVMMTTSRNFRRIAEIFWYGFIAFASTTVLMSTKMNPLLLLACGAGVHIAIRSTAA